MVTPRVYRRRRLFATASLLLLTVFIWWGIAGLNQSTHQQIKENSTLVAEPQDLTEQELSVSLPNQGTSAIAVSGLGIVAQHEGETVVPIASIAKTITALVVLEKLTPDGNQATDIDLVFDKSDEEIRRETIAENGASQPVSDGLTMTLHDALATMLLASANNYATSLAIKAFGSMDAYLNTANEWLQNQGLTNTHVADASGLSPQTVGTANDLVMLGLLAMDNPEVSRIVSTPIIDVEGVGTIQNGNPMFGIDGVDGIKLGSTYEANNCLLYSKLVNIEGNEVRIVGSTLGLDEFSTIIEEATFTLDQVSNGLLFKEIVPKDTVFGTVTNTDGKHVSISTSEALTMVMWPGITVIATPEINEPLTVSTGNSAGKLSVRVGVSTHDLPLIFK